MNPDKKERHYSKSQVRKGAKFFLYGRLVTSIISLSIGLIIVRELSIQDYAFFTALSGLLLIIMFISGFGLERTVPKFLSELKGKNQNIQLKSLTYLLIKIRIVTLALFLVLVSTMYEYIFSLLGIQISLQLLMYFVVYAFLFGISMHLLRTLQTLMLQKTVAISMVLEWSTKLVFFIVALYYFDELTIVHVFALQLIPVLLAVMVNFYSLQKFINNLEHSDVDDLDIEPKRMVSFSLQNYFQTLAGFHFLPSTGRVVAATFFSQASLASLGFAYVLAESLKRYLPTNLFLGLIEPVIMSKYSKNKDYDQIVRLTKVIFKLNLFIIIPVMVWIYLSSAPIIDWISNNKYGDSVWLISAMLFILVLEGHRGILQLICNSIDESGLLLTSNLLSIFLGLIWLYAIDQYALVGFVVGLSVMLVLRNVYVVYRLSAKGFHFSSDWFAILKIVLLAAFSCSISQVVTLSFFEFISTAQALSSLIVSILLYLSFGVLLKPFTHDEREQLNSFLGKKVFIW